MPQRAPRQETSGLAARRSGLDLLTLVRAGASLDDALENCRSFNALEGADRSFARLLATLVLRRQGALDTLIGAYIDKPLPKRAEKATDMLRLAAAQSAFLDTPDHAAVSTAVELSHAFRETEGYAALINAVARKVAKGAKAAVAAMPERIDTPGWMWRVWERTYGPAAARAIALAHREEPPLDLTLRRLEDREPLAERLGAEILSTGALRLKAVRDVTALPAYADGLWWVQDAAAALPAKLLGDIEGKRVFDLCAAPGGKTMQLAAAGANVTAVDSVGARLKLVADNLQRTLLKAETVKADVLDWQPHETVDAVLLDAPCTATGTIRRHPDILRTASEDDVAIMARVQSRMIDRSVSLLKPGGVLVYSTCSLQPEEGEKQIEAALGRHPALARVPISAAEIGGLADAVTRQGDLRTLPSMLGGKGGMDGFFAARLRLTAGGAG